MKRERIYYLDIAKGIGVILMILGHIPDLTLPTRQYVTSFHMPLFFVISGVIICAIGEDKRDKRTVLRRKLRSIMVPYVVFSCLSLLVEIGVILLLENSTWEIFREHLFATVCLAGASVFWFLPTLFFGELIFLGIRRKTTAPVCGIVTATLAAVAYVGLLGKNYLLAEYTATAWYPYLNLFLNGILRFFFAAAFVAVGYVGFTLMKKLSGKTGLCLAGGIVLLVLTGVVSTSNGTTDMNYMVYNNIFLYLITSIGGSFGILLLSSGLERWYQVPPLAVCRYYGRNSLIVMMTHAPFYIMYVAARLTYAVNNHIFPLGQVLLCILMISFVLLIEIVVIEVLNRYFAFLLGRGGRKKEPAEGV